MNTRKEFGQFLKERRRRVGKTQAEVATALGYTNCQFISNLERGICSFPMDMAKKYCREIKLNPDDFLSARTKLVVADQKKRFFRGKH